MNEPAKPERRWFQFRLRTLLIAVMLLALPLSWVAVRMERARRQREVVDEIVRLGGVSLYDWEATPPPIGQSMLDVKPYPAWLRKLLGDDFFDTVASVSFPPQPEWDPSHQTPSSPHVQRSHPKGT